MCLNINRGTKIKGQKYNYKFEYFKNSKFNFNKIFKL